MYSVVSILEKTEGEYREFKRAFTRWSNKESMPMIQIRTVNSEGICKVEPKDQ